LLAFADLLAGGDVAVFAASSDALGVADARLLACSTALSEDAGVALGGLDAVQAGLAESVASDVIGRANSGDAVFALTDALRGGAAGVAASSAAEAPDANLAVAVAAAVSVHGAGLAAHVSRGVLAGAGLAISTVSITAVLITDASATASGAALSVHAQVAVRVAFAVCINSAPDTAFALAISGGEEEAEDGCGQVLHGFSWF
jgi:hypothetical protein